MTPNINKCADIDDNNNDDDDDTMFTKSISTWFNFHLSFICCDKVSPLNPTDTHTHTRRVRFKKIETRRLSIAIYSTADAYKTPIFHILLTMFVHCNRMCWIT